MRMENEDDPFSGSWRFNRERSQLNTPGPKQWFQEIRLIDGEVVVRERVVRSDGIEMVVSVRARFDERDYAVEGSPIADTIAYKRVDMNTISGVGKKNGFISIVETLRRYLSRAP